MPAAKQLDILNWLKQIWIEFPIEIVQNSFKGCKYVFEDELEYNKVTESESELEN